MKSNPKRRFTALRRVALKHAALVGGCLALWTVSGRASADDPPAGATPPASSPASSPASPPAPSPASPPAPSPASPPAPSPASPPASSPASSQAPRPNATTPKRALPDYDGLGPAPTTAGDVALWVPRVVLSPLYFTTEWLIRRPLGAALTAAERANVPETLYDFFAFGPDHKAGVAPTVFVDFGFNPSIGLYGFWDDAFFKGNDLRAHLSFWPDEWVGGSLVERIRFHDRDFAQLKLLGISRPDQVFYGIGPETPKSAESRYRLDKIDGGVTAHFASWRSSALDTSVGVRAESFGDGHYGGDPGIVEASAAGVFPLPDGFAQGYTAEYNGVRAAIDSRRPYPADGSGVRIEALGEQGNDVRQSPGSGWIKYGAGVGGFWDVNGYRRVLSLSAYALFSDPLGPRPVPFTELVALGGDIATPGDFPAPMPGFYPGRLVGRSGAVATLRYKWPIAPWVDGSLQAAVGDVFGEHLEGFDVRLGRLSGALGIETDGSPDSTMEVLVGIGTEPFALGTQIDTVRLAVGLTRF
jgi:hypothetical protein